MSHVVENALKDVNSSEFIFHDRALEVRNAVIIWANFAGKEDRFKNKVKNFNLVLNESVAQKLANDGWKVRVNEYPAADGSGNVDKLYLVNIKINFHISQYDGKLTPEVLLYSEFRGHRTVRTLDEESVGTLDSITIQNASCMIRPYTSPAFPDKVTGYLNALSVIQESAVDFGGKYDDWLEEAQSPQFGMPGQEDVLPFGNN